MSTSTATKTVVPRSKWHGPVFSTNTTATSFATIAPTLTKPSTDASSGVAIVDTYNQTTKFAFYGTDAANETFDLKIVAWSRVESEIAGSGGNGKLADKTVEWIPTGLAFLTVTLGATTGVANGVIGGTGSLLADEIVEKATTGYATGTVNYVSTADGVPAIVEVDHGGAQVIGLYFDSTGAASMNALYMNT